MMDLQSENRELFGGAMSIRLPGRFVDVSDYRPVPDHQEERSPVTDAECGQFYFSDQATANESLASTLDSIIQLGPADVPGIPSTSFCCLVAGTQIVSKGSQGPHAANKIQLLLAILRLANTHTELLLVLNSPLDISPHSAAAEHAGSGLRDTPSQVAPSIMAHALQSLQIHDWSLFGGT